jgi:hypothetical protein
MVNCERFWKLDGQKHPVLKLDDQNQTVAKVDGQKWTFSI